jgi:hypothetical protein
MRRTAQVLILLAVLLSALPEAVLAQTAENCPNNVGRAPRANEITPTPFWNTEFIFPPGGFRPVSMTSDGQSIYLLDQGDQTVTPARSPRIVRIPLHERSYRTCVLPVPDDWTAAGADPRKFSVILLGPRAFYLVSNPDQAPYLPTVYRADRFPTAIRGGWRALRQLQPAEEGLDAVVENTTLFALRSDPVQGYEVDWQPIESTTAESIVPPGTTIHLADKAEVTRPAAGVAVAERAIYVFGGRFSARDVVRIPLKNRVPTEEEGLPQLPSDRIGGRALIHARFLYLVGGNAAGRPTIERTAVPLSFGTSGIQWDAMPEPPAGSGAIIASTFAKGKLWLVRENGNIETTSAEAIQPGKTAVEWGSTIRRQRIVQKGDSFTVDLPLRYSGPQDMTDLSVEFTASPLQTDSPRNVTFASFVPSSLPSTSVLRASPARSPSTGPTLQLQVDIPTTKVRTEYIAIALLRSGPASGKSCLATLQVRPCLQKIGPQLVLRFVVDKRPPTPGPTPTP